LRIARLTSSTDSCCLVRTPELRTRSTSSPKPMMPPFSCRVCRQTCKTTLLLSRTSCLTTAPLQHESYLHDHDAELVVEVTDAKHLCPEAFAGSQRIHAWPGRTHHQTGNVVALPTHSCAIACHISQYVIRANGGSPMLVHSVWKWWRNCGSLLILLRCLVANSCPSPAQAMAHPPHSSVPHQQASFFAVISIQ